MATTTPVPRTVPAIHVHIDELLMRATYPLDEQTVEEILYTHGPERWEGRICRACGYIYTPDSRDCPSVTVAVAAAR